MSTKWVDLALVRPIIMTAVETGASLEAIFREADMEVALMDDPEVRIDLEQRHRLVLASIR